MSDLRLPTVRSRPNSGAARTRAGSGGSALPGLRSVLRGIRSQVRGARDWRVATKLALVMSVVALLPLALIINQNDTRQRSELLESQYAAIQRATRNTASAIDDRIAMRQRQLVAVASSTVFGRLADNVAAALTAPPEDVRFSLYDLVRTEEVFDTAFVATARGELISSSGAMLNYSFADKTFFKAALNGKPAVSDLELHENGRRYLYYAIPLRGKQETVSAILALRVQSADIEQFVDLDKDVLGPGSYGVLWDRTGNRIRGGQTAFAAKADPDLSRELAESRSTSIIPLARPEGILLVGLQASRSTSLFYTVVQPEAAVVGSLNAATRTSILVFMLVLLGVVGASIAVARIVTRPLRGLQRLAGSIRAGDYLARAEVGSRDEIGDLALSVNQMLDEILVLIQTKDERDRIQQQIINLLAEVSSAASGDLTIEANVTEGELGSVADAFNYMVGELRTIIANVNATTIEVSSSTGQILAASNLLVDRAGEQAEQIAATSRAIDELSGSVSRVSENARSSAEVAGEAREYARQGLDSVRATMQGMQRIRGQVQQTAKQIKRLGESSQEIGQIVQLIEEMAEKTDLLALNAAIQAAMAGEHGRGFAVVAEEVRRLAERAANATRQISMLVQSIQADTAQAVIAMENNTHEVVEGSRLADTAGHSLETIDSVVSRLAGLIEEISRAAEEQAGVSRGVARAMSQISDATRTTSAGSRQTAESVNYLARLADQLRSSVATFKLSKSEA